MFFEGWHLCPHHLFLDFSTLHLAVFLALGDQRGLFESVCRCFGPGEPRPESYSGRLRARRATLQIDGRWACSAGSCRGCCSAGWLVGSPVGCPSAHWPACSGSLPTSLLEMFSSSPRSHCSRCQRLPAAIQPLILPWPRSPASARRQFPSGSRSQDRCPRRWSCCAGSR